ncbi:MAG: HD domain-containing phosphohydrolase, partial [Armatimonadota bacterium]
QQLISKGTAIDPLCARVAGEHHEDFCGTGYPRGRKGKFEEDPKNGIHLMTRIVTIADVYSALLMKRVYKESYQTADALKVMNDCSAKFDPEIFSAFVSEVVKSLNEEANTADHGRILEVVNGKLREFSSGKRIDGISAKSARRYPTGSNSPDEVCKGPIEFGYLAILISVTYSLPIESRDHKAYGASPTITADNAFQNTVTKNMKRCATFLKDRAFFFFLRVPCYQLQLTRNGGVNNSKNSTLVKHRQAIFQG